MDFIENNIYHVYNQGNNRQRIFFTYDNQVYFLDKIRKHILPYADILAWCLMYNHFHLMIYVNRLTPDKKDIVEKEVELNELREIRNIGYQHCSKDHTLNYSIGIMLSSYSQSINKQLKRSGSLFRNNTKSECVTNCKGISPSFIDISGGTIIKNYLIEKEYPKACFDYIHHNPVKSGLVEKPEDWEFSSYRDVYGLRNGSLINRERIEEYGLK